MDASMQANHDESNPLLPLPDAGPTERPCPLPRSTQGLRALIGLAVMRGVVLGRELGPEFETIIRRRGFATGPQDWAHCDAQVDAALDELMGSAAERLPAYCAEGAPAARYVAMALRGGLLRGIEGYRDTLLAADGQQPIDRELAVPEDPAWLLEAANELLDYLLAVLDVLRIPVPGATEHLLEASARQRDPVLVYAAPPDSERWEARTSWIADPDGPSYQWALRRHAGRVHLGRRALADPIFERVAVIREDDLGPLIELMRAAQSAARSSSS